MIVHIDSDQPKSLEQKVQELILKKLYIKVDDEKIFIDKETFVSLILQDVIALAIADFDVDLALKISLKEQAHYKATPEIKRNELAEFADEFAVEVEAYHVYLNDSGEGNSDDDIYFEVLSVLNSEIELLEKKLHELMMESLSLKLSESDAVAMGFDRWSLLDNFARYVKFIASNVSIDDAVEEMQLDMELFPEKYMVRKESVKRELERIAPLAKDEINAYKMALALFDQNAEFSVIISMGKELLHLGGGNG